jgi:hypothetical protein
MKSYNVILFTDAPAFNARTRSYGGYRIASELRAKGYSVLTIGFAATMDWGKFTKVIDLAVGDNTLVIGFSTNAFLARKFSILKQSYEDIEHTMGFDKKEHPWYFENLSYQFSRVSTKPFIDYIKQKNPKIKCLVGGITAYDYTTDPYIDNVFIGFSENKLLDYVNSLSGRGPKRIFNKVVDYDRKAQDGLFNFNNSHTEYVETDNLHKEELLFMEFGRGCIFNCAFCSYPHRNQKTKDYLKYQEIIRKELMTNWEKWGTYKYGIIDDTFNDSTEKLMLINEVIQSLPFKPQFWAYIRLDLIGRFPEQAQLLKDIGLRDCYWGIETWNNKSAVAIGKGGKMEKKLETLKMVKECWGDDITIGTSIIVGLPYDNEESVRASADWYVNGGYKFINDLSYSPLILKSEDETAPYQWKSEIEENVTKYGYTVYDNYSIDYPVYWEKSDDGDIKNFIQANDLANEMNEKIQTYLPRRSNIDKLSVFYGTIPNLNRDFRNLIYDYANANYWPKLFSQLINTSNDTH